MAKENFKKQIIKISEGLLSSLTNLILVFVNCGYEFITDPKTARSLGYGLYKIDKRMEKINYLTIKRAIKNAREKGWIKEDLRISREGKRRLENIFLKYSPPGQWDGSWYLVSFDIPEKLHGKRDILRENLKTLGFGKLQNSVWISAYNLLGDVQKIVKNYSLGPYVILAISSKVGQMNSKNLAEKIWKLSEIQNKYKRFIDDFKNKQSFSVPKLYFKYHNILRGDPFLPKQLLPETWKGKEAYKLYLRLTNKKKK